MMTAFITEYLNSNGLEVSDTETNIDLNRRLNRNEAINIIGQILFNVADLKLENDKVFITFKDMRIIEGRVIECISRDPAAIKLFELLTNEYFY